MSYFKLNQKLRTVIESANKFHSFDISKASGRVSTHQVGRVLGANKVVDAIFVGAGVFLSCYPQHGSEIEFEGELYRSEQYFPTDHGIVDFICIYYVDELSDVRSQVKLSESAVSPFVTCSFAGKKYKFDLMRPSYKGKNVKDQKRLDALAKEYGVEKYLLPNRELVGFEQYRTQAVHVRGKGFKSMGVIAYHNTQDWTRSQKVGKVRVFTQKSLDGLWVKF